MSAMASLITGVSIVCSAVCLCADQRKYQSSASLAFERGIHRWPVDSPHKGPVTRKIFLFDDVIMSEQFCDEWLLYSFMSYSKTSVSILRIVLSAAVMIWYVWWVKSLNRDSALNTYWCWSYFITLFDTAAQELFLLPRWLWQRHM